jgi:hypothetical protein
MKLVHLFYLEEDAPCVARILSTSGIEAYSRVDVEGHGRGGHVGWYGKASPYRSEVIVAVLPDTLADGLLDAVEGCRGQTDDRHPIHAVLIDVERATSSAGNTDNTGVIS